MYLEIQILNTHFYIIHGSKYKGPEMQEVQSQNKAQGSKTGDRHLQASSGSCAFFLPL